MHNRHLVSWQWEISLAAWPRLFHLMCDHLTVTSVTLLECNLQEGRVKSVLQHHPQRQAQCLVPNRSSGKTVDLGELWHDFATASVEIWLLQVACVQKPQPHYPAPVSFKKDNYLGRDCSASCLGPQASSCGLGLPGQSFSMIAACLIRSTEMKTEQWLLPCALN